MPTENINIETQVQVDITRAELQALIAGGTVKKKLYHITDAIGGTAKILVWSLTTSTTSFNAANFTNGRFGKYFITSDVFVPIVEGMGGVVSYNSFAVFPTTGLVNTVYIDLSTDDQYYWDGSAYQPLDGGNVYEPTVDDFPLIGSTDTLYVATETGLMYLWDGSGYVALNNNGNYIPLVGTEVGSPVTGAVETSNSGAAFYGIDKDLSFGSTDDVDFDAASRVARFYSFTDLSSVLTGLQIKDALGEIVLQFSSDGTDHFATLGSPTFGFRGLQYGADYSANFTLRSLIDQEVMKSRIWTKAGTPTTTDDGTAGYLVGSLIWDTTNSILYKCTDNTAGAATWDLAIQPPTMYDTIRIGAVPPLSSIRFACVGVTGLSSSIVLNIAPPRIHTDFRVVTATPQPASGTIVIERIFSHYTSGATLHTDTLTIPAGSAAGEFTFTGGMYDASGGANLRFAITNTAASGGAFLQGIENQYTE